MYDLARRTDTILSTTVAAGAVTGGAFYPMRTPITFQAYQVGTGAQTSTILIEATSLPGVAASWVTVGTISLSGTTTAVDAFSTTAGFTTFRARVTAIVGTSAVLTVQMSV